MAEEQEATEETKKKSSLVSNLIMLGIAVILPLCLALILFIFVIKPIIEPPGGEDPTGGNDKPGPLAVGVPFMFDDAMASVVPEGNEPALLLMFSVLVYHDPEITQILTDNKELFESMFVEKMQNKTRTELMDPLVRASLKKIILREANSMIEQIDEDAEGKKVLLVKFHSFNTIPM
jgi:hypothetical protein